MSLFCPSSAEFDADLNFMFCRESRTYYPTLAGSECISSPTSTTSSSSFTSDHSSQNLSAHLCNCLEYPSFLTPSDYNIFRMTDATKHYDHEDYCLFPTVSPTTRTIMRTFSGPARKYNTTDDMGLLSGFPSCLEADAFSTFSRCDSQILASTPSTTLFSLSESPTESTSIVTPELKQADILCPDASSLTLSPYTPLPLPPIFSHESGSMVAPIQIDTSPYNSVWMTKEYNEEQRHLKNGCENTDSSSDRSLQYGAPVLQYSFTRGNATADSFWPPTTFTPLTLLPLSFPSNPMQENFLVYPRFYEQPKQIPLEVAESQAAEFRTAGNNASLSSPFLMQFLGQPAGQTKWHCYIRGCGKQLTRKGHMMDHVRMHLHERVFSCEHCSQTFLRKADCKRHVATHNPTRGYHCGSCSKSYARKDLLTRHSRVCPFRPGSQEETPAKKMNRGKKRKGVTTPCFTVNSSNSHYNLDFVSPDMFMYPQGYLVGKSDPTYLCNEGSKENINPLLSSGEAGYDDLKWNAYNEWCSPNYFGGHL